MRRRRSRGFTLVELAVVLLVLALAAALVVPAVGRGVDTLRVRAEVARVAGFLRAARQQAVTLGEPLEVRLDPAARTLVLLSGNSGAIRSARKLSADLEIASELPGRAVVTFFPQGLSSGGGLSIRAPGARLYIIRVDSITGRVSSRLADS